MLTIRMKPLPLVTALASLCLAPAGADAAWPSDPTINVPLCTAANNQYFPTIVSDGAGGAIVTWEDFRSGTNADIYAQRVAFGVPLWTADGVALCTAAGNQQYPTIVSDGLVGAIVTWQDDRGGVANTDIYAQRVTKDGLVPWTPDGVALCTAASYQYSPTIVSDGAGGAIVTWYDHRSGTNYDIYAQRVNAAGVPQCNVDGVKVCTAAGDQLGPTIVAEGQGGAIVTWRDNRGTDGNIYAQNINGDCTLGGTLVSVPAVPIAASFALSRVEPNPSVGELRVSFSLLDDTPASLEVYDLTGRRLESQELGRLGAGAHIVSLGRGVRWPPGIYEVRLKQGSRSGFRKVAIVR